MATSGIFLGAVLITMLMGPLIITSTSGLTMDDISHCRKKIIESEQGMASANVETCSDAQLASE